MREPNPDKLNELVGKLVCDLGAAIAGAGILLGDRLGIYKAMADGTPVTSSDLAKKTGLHERYLRQWLFSPATSVFLGRGTTIVMAQAYPRSQFFGFDYYQPSLDRAANLAKEAEVGDRITFEQASAKDFPARGYDLVAFFDCLHDMGDPVGAGRHVKEALARDGVWMIVEPFAHDNLKDNLNPVGRVLYGASTFICTPASLSQEVALGLGAQAGERRLRQVATEAGFTRFRRAAETRFNMIFEARA
jgi:SAM-dependent methyltransferase